MSNTVMKFRTILYLFKFHFHNNNSEKNVGGLT